MLQNEAFGVLKYKTESKPHKNKESFIKLKIFAKCKKSIAL